jgi:DNA-directed RNA polymerase specialized sigma24 family protein
VPTIDRSPAPGNGSPERIGVTAVLREGLEFMDDEIRAAFVLRDLLELPVDEVAAVLETSPQDVGRRIHRARLMLQGLLARL